MKHLEKIVFLICLLVTAGAAAWVFLGSSKETVEARIPALASDFELYSYEGLDVISEANWPAPEAQDAEGKWLYRVFTPPILYLVDGVLTVERPEDEVIEVEEEEPAQPFGVRFAEVLRDRYRLQLAAVYETKLDDVDSAILSFENVYAGLTDRPTITLRKGETSEPYEFRVEDVEKEERIDAGGGMETEHVVTITDLRTGETIELSDRVTLYEDGMRFVFESTIDPSQTAIVESAGQTFEMNEATYTVVTINLDGKTAQVLKEADYLDAPEQQTLSLSSGSAQRGSPVPPAGGGSGGTGEAPENDLPDGIFN